MIDWQPNIAGLITAALMVIGFFGTMVVYVLHSGRFLGAIEKRMEALEKETEKITSILVEMAQSKVEITLLAERMDRVQKESNDWRTIMGGRLDKLLDDMYTRREKNL